MARYRCTVCGDIYDDKIEARKFRYLDASFKCSKCGSPKALFKIENKKDTDLREKSVRISDFNVSIDRIIYKCINCGLCVQTCIKKEGMKFDRNSELCVGCGQCIQTCPVGALIPDFDYNNFKRAKRNGKICVAYVSPATRVAFGEIFKKKPGSFEQSKLVGFLRMLGFDYVFDTTFGADLTIVEEANEFVYRLRNDGVLPMFTSCCPSWVKYLEQFYPALIPNLSTCKSPIAMTGSMVKNYFADNHNLSRDNLFTVAITPCTAKKYEVNREEIDGTDLVITLYELERVAKEENIKYEDISYSDFDTFFKEGSGGGMLFGTTGGVMESALRTTNYILTKENLKDVNFEAVRGLDNVKEASITIGDRKLNVCVINEISSAKEILEDILKGKSKYDYIEVMNCHGGCLGGGGQPKALQNKELEVKEARMQAIYNRDSKREIRFAHENPQVKKVYDDFLGKPMGRKAHQYLHTTFEDKSYLIKK